MRPLDDLVRLVDGELDAQAADALEEHALGCDECSRQLERLAALTLAIREAGAQGLVRFALTPSLLSAIEASGLPTKHYRVPAGGRVACGVGTDDAYVITTLYAQLDEAERVDVQMEAGPIALRMRDVPFDRARGQVMWAESGAQVRTYPTMTISVRVLAVDHAGERTLGEYRLDHEAYRAPPG
jgi:hypothetical protein